MRRAAPIAVAALVLALAAGDVTQAVWRSLGYVAVAWGCLGRGDREADLARAKVWFRRAGASDGAGTRATLGMAIADLFLGDPVAAVAGFEAVTAARPDDEVVRRHLLRAAADARDATAFLAAFDLEPAADVRRSFRDAAAALAVAAAADRPAAIRPVLIDRSLRYWPDNLCALAAAGALDGDGSARTRILERRFDGSYSTDPAYAACLTRWLPELRPAEPRLRAIIDEDVVEPAAALGLVDFARAVAGTAAPAQAGTGATAEGVPGPDILSALSSQRLDQKLSGAWHLQGVVLDETAAATADRRDVWLLVRSGQATAGPAGATSFEGGWVLHLSAPSLLTNGDFELGTGLGPYTPWAFARAGQSPGYDVVADAHEGRPTKAIRFDVAARAAELRQQMPVLEEGHLCLFGGLVKSDRPTDRDRGIAVYSYWLTPQGTPHGFARVLGGLSAFPDWRSFTHLETVPAAAAAAVVAYTSTDPAARALLDRVFVLDLTSSFLAALNGTHE